eukprot:CAMPEP_0117568182 /NCGR_PEP_ID=MMETSP0784-20121206/58002_1 /TAXON_ID=39447 /ORGANISM="" /LENGTH=67 /DNA_ID=CAMNT_0005366099 /DNA_START=128 /DNA_END=327 /DNA_ORIENTATION=+
MLKIFTVHIVNVVQQTSTLLLGLMLSLRVCSWAWSTGPIAGFSTVYASGNELLGSLGFTGLAWYAFA